MSARTLTLFTLCFLHLASAIPTQLSPRSPNADTSVIYDNNGFERHNFFSTTCANDKSMWAFSTNVTVNTRPDCDTTINTICRAVEKLAKAGAPLNGVGHTEGTCEGHIVYNGPGDPNDATYGACVQGFQSITDTCMLMGDPNVPHNEASVGKQFGALNAAWYPAASVHAGGSLATWIGLRHKPGFLIGPPHVWGDLFNETGASDILQ